MIGFVPRAASASWLKAVVLEVRDDDCGRDQRGGALRIGLMFPLGRARAWVRRAPRTDGRAPMRHAERSRHLLGPQFYDEQDPRFATLDGLAKWAASLDYICADPELEYGADRPGACR
jgi:hypothetical protein